MDANISERTATAMLYAIKSDTLFFNRQANRVDLEAFSFLYPLSDATLIRKMEGAEITLERLELRHQGHRARHDAGAGVLRLPRRGAARGLHPLRRGLLPAARRREVDDRRRHRERLVRGVGAEPRLLTQRGELVRKLFADIGSAGGHRAMAKAVVPIDRYRQKFGELDPATGTETILKLALQFLHESSPPDKRPR